MSSLEQILWPCLWRPCFHGTIARKCWYQHFEQLLDKFFSIFPQYREILPNTVYIPSLKSIGVSQQKLRGGGGGGGAHTNLQKPSLFKVKFLLFLLHFFRYFLNFFFTYIVELDVQLLEFSRKIETLLEDILVPPIARCEKTGSWEIGLTNNKVMGKRSAFFSQNRTSPF